MIPRILAITGATTSGKTDLSLAVAREIGGEIVSMDSRQVYRGMDIGTDKVDRDARRRSGVPHFGLDLVAPDERFSAGRFARAAREWIADIESRGHVPVFAGGTGFFLKALLEPIFEEPPMDPAAQDRIRAILSVWPVERLARWVQRLDPDRAEIAIPGGPQRMIRTLEVPLLTGRPLSWWHDHAREDGPAVPAAVFWIVVDREELDRRIDARVDRMMEAGLLDEVRALLEAGYRPGDPGMTGTGYREMAQVLAGELDLAEGLDRMRLQTRQYARRQITWFRHQLPADAVKIDGSLPLERKVELIVHEWRRRTTDGTEGTE